jgi:FRG domain-containing protein
MTSGQQGQWSGQEGHLLEKKAGSVGELIDAVRSILSFWNPAIIDPQEVWFRGQSKASQSLLPGLYRPAVRDLHYDEIALVERFKVFATPHLRQVPADDWDWYFLAQHYGLPTRLLDWSESVLAAAYFACCETILSRNRLALEADLVRGKVAPVFDDDSPVVWLIDAGTINLAARGDDQPFFPGGPLTKEYLPEPVNESPTSDNKPPLALIARHTNERITAQQGTFTIHGHDMAPLDTLASSNPSIKLARIMLDKANISHFWSELEIAGISRYSLFPGVDTAADHVKWIMQAAATVGRS